MADEGIKRLVELGVNASPAITELNKLGTSVDKQTANLDGLQAGLAKTVEMATSAFQALAVVDLAKQFVDGVRSMIDEMDALGKASQGVGMTAQALQELQYALHMGGGLTEDQSIAAISRFSDELGKISEKSNNTSRILRELGITASDTVDSGFAKLADALAAAPDGIDKTNLMIDLFGKNLGVKMVAALNNGSAGIQDLRDEFVQLGGVMSDTAIAQANQFNDNLDKLALNAKSLGIALTSQLLPALVEVSNAMVEAVKQGNLMDTLLTRYKNNVSDFWTKVGRSVGIASSATNAEVAATQKGFDDLAKSMDAVRKAAEPARTGTLPSIARPDKVPKARAAKAMKEQESDFEKWMDSMLKMQTASDDTAAKVDWLQRHLQALADSGQSGSELFKKWQAELLKIEPDPVTTAILKLADAAHKLDDSPKIIAGLTAEMQRLQAAGPAAGNGVKVLHDEILKLQVESGDPIAQVTSDLEKMRIQTQKNVEVTNEWFKLLGQGKITADEFADGVAKSLPKVDDALEKTKQKTFDLGKAISDASAKFVTDWVDQMVDGFGKTSDSFSDMIESMLKQLAKLMIQAQIAKAFAPSTSGGGGLGDIIGGLFKSGKGNAWAGPGVEYMASGGILTSPTFFSNGGRLAVAGEAGPEAVVPLQRDGSGNLGVSASPVTVNITNNTPSDVSTSTRDNEDGSRQVDIMITQKVKQLINSGQMDKTFRSAYGLSRQPAAGG